jgi:pyridoxine 4-dehydrogenase
VENCQDVPLTEQDLEEIQTLLATLPVAGERYGGQHEKLLNM